MPKLSAEQTVAIDRLRENFPPHSTIYGIVTGSSTRGSGYSQSWQILSLENVANGGRIVNCSLYCANLLRARKTKTGAFWTRSTLQDIRDEISTYLGYSLAFERL